MLSLFAERVRIDLGGDRRVGVTEVRALMQAVADSEADIPRKEAELARYGSEDASA